MLKEAEAEALFPDGHGRYSLRIEPPNKDVLELKAYHCALCLNKFEKYTPLHGYDSPHYEIITCPFCLLSAFATQFKKAYTANERQLNNLLSPYKEVYDFSSEAPKDADTLFAGFYLAILCAPLCFTGHFLIRAKLWLRVSWLYGECGDAAMEAYACEQALRFYINAYEVTDMPNEQQAHIQMIIQELNEKVKSTRRHP